ncbi:MAG: N4-gp56 family major capsid protein [Anaerolineales bacterium]|nr:N4-gp56 family major capsid protein [Anaerolineales bacterium]
MANITQTSFSDAVKTFYEKRLLWRAFPRLVHSRWGVKAKINKYGSLEWRRYSGLSAITTALTEGSTPIEQPAPTITPITSTPLFYGAWVGYTDEINMTAYDPFVTEVSGILGEQAGLSIDTLVRDVITAGATKVYSNGKGSRATLDSPGDDISYRDFIIAVATLMAANALPIGGVYQVILHPHSYFTLMQEPSFVNVFVAEAGREAQSPIRSGYMGRFLMCDVYVTSNAREYADGGVTTTDVYSAMFIGEQSYGCVGIGAITPRDVDLAGPEGAPGTGNKFASPVAIIGKQLGSAGADDPLDQRATIGWKAAEDEIVLNIAFMVDLEHTNIFSDA